MKSISSAALAFVCLPGLALALGVGAASAQTYKDSGGTIVPGFVPLGGCPVGGGNCGGPASSTNPLTVNSKPTTGTGAYSAVTVGTTDSTIVTASTAAVLLDVVNNSSTATICLNLGATATITGTACAAGEITLPPLWHRSWEGTFVPTDAVHAIASAASTLASVGVK